MTKESKCVDSHEHMHDLRPKVTREEPAQPVVLQSLKSHPPAHNHRYTTPTSTPAYPPTLPIQCVHVRCKKVQMRCQIGSDDVTQVCCTTPTHPKH